MCDYSNGIMQLRTMTDDDLRPHRHRHKIITIIYNSCRRLFWYKICRFWTSATKVINLLKIMSFCADATVHNAITGPSLDRVKTHMLTIRGE